MSPTFSRTWYVETSTNGVCLPANNAGNPESLKNEATMDPNGPQPRSASGEPRFSHICFTRRSLAFCKRSNILETIISDHRHKPTECNTYAFVFQDYVCACIYVRRHWSFWIGTHWSFWIGANRSFWIGRHWSSESGQPGVSESLKFLNLSCWIGVSESGRVSESEYIPYQHLYTYISTPCCVVEDSPSSTSSILTSTPGHPLPPSSPFQNFGAEETSAKTWLWTMDQYLYTAFWLILSSFHTRGIQTFMNPSRFDTEQNSMGELAHQKLPGLSSSFSCIKSCLARLEAFASSSNASCSDVFTA